MKTNKILMGDARAALAGKWKTAVLTTLVYFLIVIVVSSIPKAGRLINFIISGPLLLGWAMFWLSLSRGNNPELEMIFSGFKSFGKALGLYCLMALFIILWALLFIIPGILAALSYSMAFYILADNKDIGVLEAIRKSKAMMYGRRWKLVCLSFRFFGWFLLSMLTAGIGFLWFAPYTKVAMVKFYDDIKNITPEPQA